MSYRFEKISKDALIKYTENYFQIKQKLMKFVTMATCEKNGYYTYNNIKEGHGDELKQLYDENSFSVAFSFENETKNFGFGFEEGELEINTSWRNNSEYINSDLWEYFLNQSEFRKPVQREITYIDHQEEEIVLFSGLWDPSRDSLNNILPYKLADPYPM